jgi:RNAse (barnase) inhibitor barstar
MATIRLNTNEIADWATFHSVCKQAMGFPAFYGNNMSARIDCLTYLGDDDQMTKFTLAENERLEIEINETEQFKTQTPEIYNALITSTAFVNQRYLERGKQPKLSLIFL